MIEGIRFLGKIGSDIQYELTVWGFDAIHRVFHETTGIQDRFFSGGNEFYIDLKGIKFRGYGGILCQYMFGVEMPIEDLIRKDVVNKLIIFGAYHDPRNETLIFTDKIEGEKEWTDLFIEGHAVRNYFFFINAPLKGKPHERQRFITLRLGKILKRLNSVSEGNDRVIAQALYENLGIPDATILLLHIVHIAHRQLIEEMKQVFHEYHMIPEEHEQKFLELADELNVPRYQYERLKLDLIYHESEYRYLIDEYKDILIQSQDRTLSVYEKARLQRIRTLSVRHHLPLTLFDALDEMLLKEHMEVEPQIPSYIQEARVILESIFISRSDIEELITHDDLVRLLHAKKLASQHRDTRFEEILLEIGKQCDEYVHTNGDERPFMVFSYIVTYFDRFDATLSTITRLAYMENETLDRESLRRLLQNRKIFNELETGLFEDLFLNDLYHDPYLPYYGRKKIETLMNGMHKIDQNEMSLPELEALLNRWASEERWYVRIHSLLRKRQRDYYWDKMTAREVDELKDSVLKEFYVEGIKIENEELFNKVFQKVIFDLKKESVYIHYVLPEYLLHRNEKLREDFIQNSGLDLFYIEELEHEFCELHQIRPEWLYDQRTPTRFS